MKLKIISPAGIEAEAGNIDIIRTVLADGKPLTILPRHAPLMGEIGNTHITTISNERSKKYAINQGLLIIQDDAVSILTTGLQENMNA